jgi:hypothetical protein
MPSETPEVAQSIEGDKLYQERAKRAFPLLVRQALAHQPIFLEARLPNELVSLKNLLGVTVYDNLRPNPLSSK